MIRATCFSLVFLAALAPTPAFAQKKAATPGDDPRLLSLEVVALQSLHRLDLTVPQLENLLRLSKGAAAPASKGSVKASPAFVKTLKVLREALLADDDDAIDEAKDKLRELMDKERVAIDDRVPISDAARRGAPQIIRMLTPPQALAYMQVLDEDDVDPVDILESALERGKDADGAAWKSIRDAAASETAWLFAGSDEAKARPVAKAIASILDQQRKAKNPGRSGKTAPAILRPDRPAANGPARHGTRGRRTAFQPLPPRRRPAHPRTTPQNRGQVNRCVSMRSSTPVRPSPSGVFPFRGAALLVA